MASEIPAIVGADAPGLAALHREAFSAAEAWGADAIALMLGMPGAFGFCHPRCGFVLARVAADESEILTLAVLPAARRRGIGTALMRAAMAEAARRGATAMLLEAAAGNLAALGLYAALGFTAVGLRRRYYADGTDAVVLRAGLASGAVG